MYSVFAKAPFKEHFVWIINKQFKNAKKTEPKLKLHNMVEFFIS